MSRLNQIIAVLGGEKTRCQKIVTEVYHKLQKPNLLTGLSKRYRPKDEEGEQLPPENQRVQYTVKAALQSVRSALETLFDITGTLDSTNCVATSNIIVDGAVLVTDAPVTFLLFLEKQLVDQRTLIEKLPVLDSATTWTTDGEGISRSEPFETTRTKKTPIRFVKAEATEKFPAQVEILQEDVIAGFWTKTDFSGAISADAKALLLTRVEKLIAAVKTAREEANACEAQTWKPGKALLGYLFAGIAD